ncbi:hypothetical protein T08_16437 [Trichinella sp. T8]|nr:hypothetical protein T08_16437 [Trichinella sp. T8]
MDYAKLNRRRTCLKGRMYRLCQDLDSLIRQPESRIDVKMTLDSISKLLERCQEAQDAVPWQSGEVFGDEYRTCRIQEVESEFNLGQTTDLQYSEVYIKVLHFPSFWEQFNAGIHDNAEIADVMKFIYLRSLLEGEGLKAIDGYAVTQGNYPIARQALVSRFGNPKRVIEHHIQAIADLRPNGDRTLRELHDELVTHMRSLRALNRDASGNQFASDIILTLCKGLLPKKILSLWEDKILGSEEDQNEVETFFVFLHKHAEIEERVRQDNPKLCFRCLRQGHRSTDCKRSHNSRNVTSVGLHRLLSEDENVQAAEENCTPHGDERSEKSPETTPTDGVAGSLGLTGLNEWMCISTLGNKSCHKKLRRVSFSLKEITPNSQAKQINAYCVNRICDTWEENPPVMWEHAKDLNLTDDFPRDRCEVDGLIRIDYYYHFIEDSSSSVNHTWMDPLWYVTRLFWKHNDALPNNYYAALKRFEQFEARLRKGPSKKREYENTLQEYIKNRYVEEIGNLGGREEKIWYLPHHAVFKMEKNTSKCRIVFDGSHLCGGVSLNERLEPGQSIIADLVGILLRFRQCKISIHADITKMFLQIELHLEDRDVTRFVWRKQGEEMPRIYRFCRLPFGLSCLPFLAMSAVQDLAVNHRTEYPETAKEVLRNMYVDDILLSCDDESTAQKMVAELTKLLKIGSFELSKWSSNCTDVLSSTPQTEVTTNCSKALGMNWEHSTDIFQFPVPSESEIASCNTKRSLLSVFFKIFEILGWLSPFVVRVKILLQRLWQQGIDWDETLPPPEESMWQN